jgi:hypothetical protein
MISSTTTMATTIPGMTMAFPNMQSSFASGRLSDGPGQHCLLNRCDLALTLDTPGDNASGTPSAGASPIAMSLRTVRDRRRIRARSDCVPRGEVGDGEGNSLPVLRGDVDLAGCCRSASVEGLSQGGRPLVPRLQLCRVRGGTGPRTPARRLSHTPGVSISQRGGRLEIPVRS